MARLFGIETEYGLWWPDRGPRTQVEDCRNLLESADVGWQVPWDYALESPRDDIRGFRADRLRVDPDDAQFDSPNVIAPERERADRILENGARFYNDHGHPEYATPECGRLLELVAHDKAGERIVAQVANAAGATVYKNNSDYSGAAYGTHENYLVPRSVGWESLVTGLMPLLVCRQLLTGAGKVGAESGAQTRFQLSQRADFLTEDLSVDTLFRRPVFNTRDEPHADPAKWRRLHVICGDANRSEWATAMKTGLVQVALELVQIGEAPVWRIARPAEAFRQVSRDLEACGRIELAGSSWTTALEILESYLTAGRRRLSDAESVWVLDELESALADFRADPSRLADRADWAAKFGLLRAMADDLGKWDFDALRAVELEYHDAGESSLHQMLVDAGRMRTLVPPDRVAQAMAEPPRTRAARRVAVLREHLERIETIGWRRAVIGGDVEEFQIEGTENAT